MKNIFGFILGLIVCLIFVETYVSNSFVIPSLLGEYDDDIGMARKANRYFVRFNEGFGVGKVNQFKYLNKEYSPKKSEDTIRIALIGDSYVESFQVFDRHYFGRIMENILSKKLSKPVEVLNFGRSGFNIADCYIYYNTLVKKFNPDYVLYILGANDFASSSNKKFYPKLEYDDLSQALKISKNYLIDDSFKKYRRIEKILSTSTIIYNIAVQKDKLSLGYILPKLFDKLYVKNIENKEISEVNHNNKLEISSEIKLILNYLHNHNGYFFLRSDIEIVNSNYTFYDISQIFKNKDYNPHEWKIAKTTGHWNNRAHRDIGQYMAEEMEKIIRVDKGLATNNTNKHE